MKVGILTFNCAWNYGAVLQAYALQSAASYYSDHVSLINYRPNFLMVPYTPLFKLRETNTKHDKRTLKYCIKLLLSYLQYYLWGHKEKIAKFEKFEAAHFRLASYTGSFEGYSHILLGSDQIWNPRITKYDATYFAPASLRKNNVKVISYAASMGIDHPSANEISFIKENIDYVDNISVREESAKRLLETISNKEISVTLDPTLLLTKDFWKKFKSDNGSEKYLLLYQMSSDKNTLKIAELISKKLGLKLIEVLAFPLGRNNLNFHKKITNAGPEDFVSLFANAEYVVTSSFHGTAFSLIFNKQFVTVAHPTAGSRMRDLLAKLDLSDRIAACVNDIPVGDIDYEKVNAKLEIERQKSIAFLENALGVSRR